MDTLGVPVPPRGADLPYDDGEPLESEIHRDQMNLLIDSLDDHWRDRDDVYVAGNMFVYYSETQTRSKDVRGPDVFVVLDTVRKVRRSWVVWEEDGRRPDLVVELVSESTEAIDRGRKMDIYGRLLSVSEYYIFDPFTGRLDGYTLDAARRGYVPLVPREDGSFVSATLGGLRLGKRRGRFRNAEIDWLRWFTADGELILHASERARAESERATVLEGRIAAYEARFGKLPG